MRLSVGIATNGRNGILRHAVSYLRAQTRLPDEVVICTPAGADPISDLPADEGLKIRHVVSELGLTRQRNAILREVRDCDVLLFIDDDFFLCRDYVAAMIGLFEDAAVTVATGTVVADGIKGPGISPEAADRLVRQAEAQACPERLEDVRHGYGCNMALRYAPLVRHGLTFDENLPRYGWFEDVDLMRRLAHHGRSVRSSAARGVHLGAKSGRTSGRFLGYSQIANPVYLSRKGTFDRSEAASTIMRNLTANAVRAIAPEAYIDRRGRLLGNLIGLRDLVLRRLHPLNALTMDGVKAPG